MDLKKETDFLLKQNDLKANKKLGQNFLINEEIIDEIVQKAEITKNDVVIEIGPGLGSLTAKLLEKAQKVIAIELDDHLVTFLEKRFSLYTNFELIHNDVLKVDLKEIISHYEHVKVVANLPYYITTPIVMKLLEEKLELESITVMVQKEVGERFCASPNGKEYGAITVSILYYTNPQIVIDVPRDNFNPVPEVDSVVVKLELRKEPPVQIKDEKLFFRLIKAGFSQRRKTISNSLMGIGKTKEEMRKILEKLNLKENLRTENLSIEDFANIANLL